jgi:DNA repair protein RecN (Recombination protein N)
MLLELVVENYAVVERLRVHFHAGLNLLTGETGSGGNPGTEGIRLVGIGILAGTAAAVLASRAV